VLNFQVYLYGSAEDYNRWAELVGDDDWKWENTKKSFKAVENYEFSGAKEYSELAKPDPEEHGTEGLVKICLPTQLEKGAKSGIEAAVESGEKLNLDFNSGNPMGVGLFPQSTSAKGGRTTSATAHLVDAPKNLLIWTNAVVEKLTFEGKRVVGVETADGRNGESSCFGNPEHLLQRCSKVRQRNYPLRWCDRHTPPPASERHRPSQRT
jgi:choline dehydrogenase-like flavoprotein